MTAAGARGPSWIARARLCQRRTPRGLAPEPASAVRRLLIGHSEAGADWSAPKGRLPASGSRPRAPPSACSLAAGDAELVLTVSRTALAMCAPSKPLSSREQDPGSTGHPVHPRLPPLYSPSPLDVGLLPGVQMRKLRPDTSYTQSLATRAAWNSNAVFPLLSPSGFFVS